MSGIVNSTGARSGIIGTTVGTPAGLVLQVVNNINTSDSTATEVASGGGAGSGFSGWPEVVDCDITPERANSKIIIFWAIRVSFSVNDHHVVRLFQNIGGTYTPICDSDIDSNHASATISFAAPESSTEMNSWSDTSQDIPSSTGSYSSGLITYSVRVARYTAGGTVYINRTELNRDAAAGYEGHSTSNMTLMEVAV